MHPDLCSFVSAAVYERRLHSAAGTEVQALLADPALDPEAIAPSGLRFVFVDSLGCTPRSRPEAERLDRTYRALLGQRPQPPHRQPAISSLPLPVLPLSSKRLDHRGGRWPPFPLMQL